jgi:hypothetical protein
MRRLIVIFLLFFIVAFGVSSQDTEQRQDYFVEASVTDENPFVGEQITYVFRFYAASLPDDLTNEMPDFEGFWLSDTTRSIGERVETINGSQYFVGEFFIELYPIDDGMITIRPAELIVPETVFREGVRILGKPVTVDVRPLPESVPEGFNGAVGQFSMEVILDQASVTLGQPVTLTMAISGVGNFDQLLAPELNFPEGWRVYPNSSRRINQDSSLLQHDKKIFEWLILSERTGTLFIPEVIFVFFDPQAEEYKTIVTALPHSLDVFPGEDGLMELASPVSAEEDVALWIKPVPDNFRMSAVEPGSLFWVMWVIPPLVAFGCSVQIFLSHRKKHRRMFARKSNALRRADKRLSAAARMPAPQSNEHIVATVFAYFADKTGQARKSVTTKNIFAFLEAQKIPSEITGEMRDCLLQVEAANYLPAGFEEDLPPLIDQITEILNTIDDIWGIT